MQAPGSPLNASRPRVPHHQSHAVGVKMYRAALAVKNGSVKLLTWKWQAQADAAIRH